MPDLLECFLRLNNLDDIQRQIRQKLGLKNVYIVPGDSDSDKTAKEELGRRGALLLNDLFGSVDTVAISGGSTMAEVARMLPECLANVTILPVGAAWETTSKYRPTILLPMSLPRHTVHTA